MLYFVLWLYLLDSILLSNLVDSRRYNLLGFLLVYSKFDKLFTLKLTIFSIYL